MYSQASATELLEAAGSGNQSARDELLALVYDELRRLAEGYMQRERPGHTLQPTALVHEAYLRLFGQDRVNWQNREHFIGIAASMMRRVLVDYSRGHRRHKRGGGEYKLSLTEADQFPKEAGIDLEALDEALTKLARSHPQESQIVELRFFGGLTLEEIARILKTSDSTLKRRWDFARAWLFRELRGTKGR